MTDVLPYELVNEKIIPVYKDFEGWNTPLNVDGSSVENLPEQLNVYIKFLEEELQVPITMVSTGPDRTQTVFRSLKLA